MKRIIHDICPNVYINAWNGFEFSILQYMKNGICTSHRHTRTHSQSSHRSHSLYLNIMFANVLNIHIRSGGDNGPRIYANYIFRASKSV